MEPVKTVERYEIPLQLRQKMWELQRQTFAEKAGAHFHHLTDRAKSLYEVMSAKMAAAVMVGGLCAVSVGIDYMHLSADERANVTQQAFEAIEEGGLPDDGLKNHFRDGSGVGYEFQAQGPGGQAEWVPIQPTEKLRDMVADPERQPAEPAPSRACGLQP